MATNKNKSKGVWTILKEIAAVMFVINMLVFGYNTATSMLTEANTVANIVGVNIALFGTALMLYSGYWLVKKLK